jgi:putative heme-binding domain-containing protein
VFEAARERVGDNQTPVADRLLATRVLGRQSDKVAADISRLAELLRPQVAAELQRGAVAALGQVQDTKVPTLLLEGWKGHSPQLRSAILDILLSRDAWAGLLIAALEKRQLPLSEIDPARRQRLLRARDAALRERASALFSSETGNRAEVVARYRRALDTTGDANKGAAVFKKVCATCHRLGGEGIEVGPDLAALADKSPEALLIAILDPNRALEARYTNFNVATKDGRVLAGLIASETATSITLRRQEGKEDVLLRSEIDDMASSGQSVMPEGMEKDLTVEDVAHLIAYVGATGPPRKVVAGNHPETVRPTPDGTIELRAETAELYGDSLTLEPQYGNLGIWSAATDRAAWTFEAAQAGRYAVSLDWACADGTQGNRFVLELGSERLQGKVASTGSWDRYRKEKLGEITLTAGRHRLLMRPEGRIRGALLDLRAIELKPIAGADAASCCDLP